MRRRFSIAFAPFALAACNSDAPASESGPIAPAAPGAAATPSARASLGNPAGATPVPPITNPRINDGYPDLTPAPLTPEDERTEKGARAVLLPFLRALELKEWDQAWAMLSETDRELWPMDQWRALFSPYAHITAISPTGTLEGAAGTSYYTAPTTLQVIGKDGVRQSIPVEVLLSRVNDVPGATPEQLRWHIQRVKFDWPR